MADALDPALDDPVLRHLPADPPSQLLAMGRAERGLRARVFLLLWGAGYVEVHAWVLAMGPLGQVRPLWTAAGEPADEVIDKMMADRAMIASIAGRRAVQA